MRTGIHCCGMMYIDQGILLGLLLHTSPLWLPIHALYRQSIGLSEVLMPSCKQLMSSIDQSGTEGEKNSE